jgi:hypothetical protein
MHGRRSTDEMQMSARIAFPQRSTTSSSLTTCIPHMSRYARATSLVYACPFLVSFLITQQVAVSLPNVLEAELTSGQILAPTFTTRQDLLCDGQLVSSLIDRPNSHYGFLRQSEIEDGIARKLFFAK